MIEWLVKKGYFRNANHAIWFMCTIIMFGATTALALRPVALRFIPIIGVFAHAFPLITAIKRNYIERVSDDLYTRDCIWFNVLMIVCYAALAAMILYS